MVNETCKYPGCGRRKSAYGWCTPHRNMEIRGEEMRPVHPHHKSYINEDYRKCTCCGAVKEVTEFHARTGQAGYQSNCKVCMVKRNRINNLLRKGRLEEALEQAQSLPESARELFVGKAQAAINKRAGGN